MTDTEKLAKFLEDCGDMHSAALIREQEAKIARMAKALNDANKTMQNIKVYCEYTIGEYMNKHADALRDAGIAP